MPLLRKNLTWTIPVAAYILTIVCPTVPTFVWVDILTAINNGDVLTGELVAIMAAKGIKLSYAPEDFPNENNRGQANVTSND